MASPESSASKSGIVTDATGARHIPSSVRADGTTRKQIKIRPGYRPPEDVEVYKNRTAQAFRNRGKSGVPGAEAEKEDDKPGSAASNKNAKRREARRKAKAGAEESTSSENLGSQIATEEGPATATHETSNKANGQEADPIAQDDPEAEKEKKAKKLRKKLREARDLQQKKDRGEGLLPEQLQKAIRIKELIRELGQLGLDADEGGKAE